MTIEEYINNPQGKNNMVYSHREVYRQLYTEKLNKILVRENGTVNYTLYNTSNHYICHMKVPSEVIPKFYYDVVFSFKKSALEKNLKKLEFKCYSNSPAFMFTFAHAFIKNKMFITILEDRMSKKAVEDRAKEKNPKEEIGYDKSLFFGFLLMEQKNLFNAQYYNLYSKPYEDRILLANVEDAEKKLKERQEAQGELKAQEKKEVKPEKLRREDVIHSGTKNAFHTQSKMEKVGRVNKISHTSTGSSIGKVNTITKIKKK